MRMVLKCRSFLDRIESLPWSFHGVTRIAKNSVSVIFRGETIFAVDFMSLGFYALI